MSLTWVLVGKIYKLRLIKKTKVARIKHKGKLRRVCDRHRELLKPGIMAVVDNQNCDFCIYLKETL